MAGKIITILFFQCILSVQLKEHNISSFGVHFPKFSLKKSDLKNSTKHHQMSSVSLLFNPIQKLNNTDVNSSYTPEITKKQASLIISRIQSNGTELANKTHLANFNHTNEGEKPLVKFRPETNRRLKFFKLNTIDGLLNFFINTNLKHDKNQTLNEYNFQFKIVSIQTQNNSETILKLDNLHRLVNSI
jgi:hypothetical protein